MKDVHTFDLNIGLLVDRRRKTRRFQPDPGPPVLVALGAALQDNRMLTSFEVRGDPADLGEENDIVQALLKRNRELSAGELRRVPPFVEH